jgi:hypothetical protein
MDNSSLFSNTIANLLNRLGLPYLSELEAMLILTAVFFVLLILVWLLFRKIRLWYWKTDIQIDTLKSIDSRLHQVQEMLLQNPVTDDKKTADGAAARDGGEEQECVKPEPEGKGIFAIGKSGKIYTEAELELQIRE